MAHLPNEQQGAPLKLYFKLEDGHTADAEVVARASLAFIAGVKEICYIIDPSTTISVGLQGHDKGSLWEEFLLLAGKAKSEVKENPIPYQVALAAFAWIMAPPLERIRDNAWGPTLDKYLPKASSEEKADVLKTINIAESGKIAVREKQQFYREIGRDTGIIGVAANVDRSKPAWIVPRNDFASYSGQSPVLESALDRSTIGPMRVIILSPVLEVSGRRWKFATAQGEFGASIRDTDFLERIVEGRTAVRMRGGVELDVELETKERLVDGVWTVFERNVIRVVDVIEPTASRQGSMFSRDGN